MRREYGPELGPISTLFDARGLTYDAMLARSLDPMDLAKNLAHWRDQSPEQWVALANGYLPPIVVALLVLMLAFKAADLTWRLLESPADQDVVPLAAAPMAATPRAGGSASYEALAAWEPFGSPPEDSVQEALTVAEIDTIPDTTLNLRLIGVVVAQQLPDDADAVVIPERGSAIIAGNRGDQSLYWSGEAIEDAGNASLHSVFADRVLLDRGGGRLETLRYDESETVASPRANSRIAARPTQQRAALGGLNSATTFPSAVSQATELLGQHMQIAMHTENGQMVGFRLQPRGDGQVFAQLGLEAGDVLTEVNGTPLNNVGNTTQVLQTLGEAQQASVTIRRNGVDTAMVLDIGQLERLAQSLQ